MRETIKFLAFATAVIAAILAALIAIGYAGGSYSCFTYQEVTGLPTKMAALDCYIFDDGRWYTSEQYKFRQAK